MKTIEDRIYENLSSKISESVVYNYNQQLATEVAEVLSGINLNYIGDMVSKDEESKFPIRINVVFDGDEVVESVESNNVVYLYLNVSKLNITIESYTEVNTPSQIEFIKSHVGWSKVNSKCWRDDGKLYLLKLNRNTGIISRFEESTMTFKQQEVANYQNATNKDIAKELLTVDYLSDYLSKQLAEAISNINVFEGNAIPEKAKVEKVVTLNANY